MCGRIAQYRDARAYAHALTLTSPVYLFDPADRRPGFNLAPGAHPLAVLPDQSIRAIRWGYRPAWAAEQHLPQAIHARSDSAASSGYFRDMWRSGRIIIPLDGWYEWRNEGGRSQPYFVHPREDGPVLVAGLSNVANPLDHLRGDGLVLVTIANAGGLVDAHSQRPLVLGAHDAQRWLDASLDAPDVADLARPARGDADGLVWHRVSPNVNRATSDEATLIETID
ncbi:SOS response-associated peptidase [Pararobbsia silviterrae]|uniref:Abasic site processing protein n=1 Tax=Pararobbsia silviterrae TaxID=1792498 RepID=A0A494XA63_9BURK|nr:SOS response-associated peptidase [Pararobbsia silviterrae]RKP45019.1 SOS response-associated peptidase [Pararobbsia silviterrae]